MVTQPVTGYLLARSAGWPLTEGWLLAALGLYVLTGTFWLPVVWIRVRLRALAVAARDAAARLPAPIAGTARCGSPSGVRGLPAFAAVLAIVWPMVAKPPP